MRTISGNSPKGATLRNADPAPRKNANSMQPEVIDGRTAFDGRKRMHNPIKLIGHTRPVAMTLPVFWFLGSPVGMTLLYRAFYARTLNVSRVGNIAQAKRI